MKEKEQINQRPDDYYEISPLEKVAMKRGLKVKTVDLSGKVSIMAINLSDEENQNLKKGKTTKHN